MRKIRRTQLSSEVPCWLSLEGKKLLVRRMLAIGSGWLGSSSRFAPLLILSVFPGNYLRVQHVVFSFIRPDINGKTLIIALSLI